MTDIGITQAPPMWCNKCGEQFNRMSSATNHICTPNDTGFNPADTVRVGGVEGQVLRVSRNQVEVYFRSCFRAAWYSAAEVERVTP